ncbi:MAG: hypothetical protein LBS62_07290 [Clostridiales bacterium]|nr:hypothetical protein [Clostridiales bacterium]
MGCSNGFMLPLTKQCTYILAQDGFDVCGRWSNEWERRGTIPEGYDTDGRRGS